MPKSFSARMLCRFTFALKVFIYVKCHSRIRPTCSVKSDKPRSSNEALNVISSQTCCSRQHRHTLVRLLPKYKLRQTVVQAIPSYVAR
jgi:hypothetical protein